MPRARQPVRKIPPGEATAPDDYDGAWKAMSDRYFRQLLELCHPKAHAAIDWSREVENLDKDLKKLRPQSKGSDRWADKLVRVWRRPGAKLDAGQQFFPQETGLVYLHTEFQNQRDDELPLRMFTTSYRAFDRYQCPITSLVILGDKGSWEPEAWFGWSCWDTHMKLEFPVIKLWRYNEPEKWAELETLAEENPFAILIMAHLRSKATQNRASRRYLWKRELFRRLLESDYAREDIAALLDYVDWLMRLPEPYELQLDEEVEKMETMRHREPYRTPMERRGRKEGREEGRKEGRVEIFQRLMTKRFGDLNAEILGRIDKADIETLDAWTDRLIEAGSLEEIFEPVSR